MTTSALTDADSEQFERLQVLMTTPGACIVRSTLDGQEVAVAAFAWPEADGGITIEPLAILVDDALMSRLTEP